MRLYSDGREEPSQVEDRRVGKLLDMEEVVTIKAVAARLAAGVFVLGRPGQSKQELVVHRPAADNEG